MTPVVLIVEDQRRLAEAMSEYLARRGHEPLTAATGEEALEVLRGGDVDLAVLDYHLPGMNGMEVLRQLRQISPGTGVVMVTAHGSVKLAVEAMRAGAFDYLTKPVDLEELAVVVDKAWEHVRLEREVRYLQRAGRDADPRSRIVGASSATASLRAQVERLAALEPEGGAPPPILITGETGTGKGLIARAIHDLGPRADRPFVELNCAAIPVSLLESELFGHERGAFTDARGTKAGLFEFGDGGTVFLDEIGAMPLDAQAKCLKLIEERSVRRLGGLRARRVDVRVLAATNSDLDAAVAAGTFRADLLYRLKVLVLPLLPLRQRRDDVLLLARHFLERAGRQYRRPKRLSPSAEASLLDYDWPGNVRELANVLERAVLLHEGEEIGAQDLGLRRSDPQGSASVTARGITVDFSQGGVDLAQVERTLITEALSAAAGSRRRAAELLGISTETLRYRLEKHGLEALGAPRERSVTRPGPPAGPSGPPLSPTDPGRSRTRP